MQIVIDIPDVYAQTEEDINLIVNIKDKTVTYVSMDGICREEFDFDILPKAKWLI